MSEILRRRREELAAVRALEAERGASRERERSLIAVGAAEMRRLQRVEASVNAALADWRLADGFDAAFGSSARTRSFVRRELEAASLDEWRATKEKSERMPSQVVRVRLIARMDDLAHHARRIGYVVFGEGFHQAVFRADLGSDEVGRLSFALVERGFTEATPLLEPAMGAERVAWRGPMVEGDACDPDDLLSRAADLVAQRLAVVLASRSRGESQATG
jgi:hypothetical protein